MWRSAAFSGVAIGECAVGARDGWVNRIVKTRRGDGDARLGAYVDAVRAMREGDYDIELDTEPHDGLGLLGEELVALARHLDWHVSHSRKLQEITDTVVGGLLMEDVLERIFDSFHSVIPYNRIGCALLSEDGSSVKACWARADYEDIRLVNGFSARMAGSSLVRIVQTGEPRILNNLEAYLESHPESHSTRLMLAEGIRSSLTCPLIDKGRPIGFLFFSSTETDAYAGVHQGVFLRIAAQLSALIVKGRLYQELIELNHRLIVAQKELQELATRDPLTGTLNRRGILDHFESMFARCRRDGKPMALIMIDVDHFKRVNDRFGHAVGDAVLSELAARIGRHLRQYNALGRFGGEEFLIVLGDEDCAYGHSIAERLRAVVADEPVMHEGHPVPVTISAGVACSPDVGAVPTGEALIAAADAALYEAKRTGRNRIVTRTLPDGDA